MIKNWKPRLLGLPIKNEELSIGLSSVAAPVRNSSGEVIAAVNIAVTALECRKVEPDFEQKAIAVPFCCMNIH